MKKQIKVLGSGCSKCNQLLESTKKAAEELGLDCEIEKIEDFLRLAEFGVMITPALVVDGKVKTTGRVPPVPEIKELIAGA
jgi:small redox-active disulfide protein 2